MRFRIPTTVSFGRSRSARVTLLPALFFLLSAGQGAFGQGIDIGRPGSGRTLPQAYFQRIRQEPDFFRASAGWIHRTSQTIRNGEALTGTMPVAVILAHFSDSGTPVVSAEEVQRAMFDGPSPFGTVTEYFSEVSGGRFTLSGQVFPWVRTSLTMAEVVGAEWGLGDDGRTGEYLFEAVAAVDATVDFGLFDNDGPDGIPNSGDDDGQVDAVAIEFQEIAASCGGPSIWPHRSRLQYWREDEEPYVTDDLRPDGSHIVVDDYVTQGATNCGGVQVQNANTIAHEMGHVLGLPDLYDRSQGVPAESRRWVVGCWSLMAAGAWGCGTQDRTDWVRPTHMGAWEKYVLGWLDSVHRVGDVLGQDFTLEPAQQGNGALMIPLQPELWQEGGGEYLLMEYRTKEGFDKDLPASGVLVYHVDPKLNGNQVCDGCPQQYQVSLLEADGNNTLRRNFQDGGNRGEAGDAWGVVGPGVLAANTYPSTRLHSGSRSPVTIYQIAIEDGVARVHLSSYHVLAESLLQPFLTSAAKILSDEERSYMDSHGNGNGDYDIGDLRAYWMR